LLRIGIQSEFVVATAEILDERMSGTDHPCRAELFQATHRPQRSLEPTMIGFDRVIGVLLGDVAGSGCQLLEYARVGRCPIRDHFSGLRPVQQGPGKEPASGRQVALLRHQHIDDLVILVNGPVQVGPSPGDLQIRFVHKPAIPGHVSAGPRRVNQQRREPLHPPVDGDVINSDTSLGQQFLDIAVRQAIPEIPAHRHHDHIGWKAEPSEAGPRYWYSDGMTTHRPSLPDLVTRRRNSA
jgi:hypothetical protein